MAERTGNKQVGLRQLQPSENLLRGRFNVQGLVNIDGSTYSETLEVRLKLVCAVGRILA